MDVIKSTASGRNKKMDCGYMATTSSVIRTNGSMEVKPDQRNGDDALQLAFA